MSVDGRKKTDYLRHEISKKQLYTRFNEIKRMKIKST